MHVSANSSFCFIKVINDVLKNSRRVVISSSYEKSIIDANLLNVS